MVTASPMTLPHVVARAIPRSLWSPINMPPSPPDTAMANMATDNRQNHHVMEPSPNAQRLSKGENPTVSNANSNPNERHMRRTIRM